MENVKDVVFSYFPEVPVSTQMRPSALSNVWKKRLLLLCLLLLAPL